MPATGSKKIDTVAAELVPQKRPLPFRCGDWPA